VIFGITTLIQLVRRPDGVLRMTASEQDRAGVRSG